MALDDRMARRTLIKGATVYVGENFEKKDGVDILIDGGRIAKIGKGIQSAGAERFDGKEYFVTPGFVNAHFHPSQQMNRALGVGISHDKQMDLLHASDSVRKPKDKYWMSHIAILEGLKGGTTCFQSVGSEIDSQVPVFERMGVRAACLMMPKDIVATEKKKAVRAATRGTEEAIRHAEELHKKYHGDLVRVHFGAVNPRYSSDDLILGMQQLADKYDVGFHMHAAEGDVYVDAVKERTGHRSVEHLHKVGALNQRVSLAHMTKLNAKEIGYLARSGAHVVHCPRANAYVAVGVCPVVDLMKAGVNVALGSDAAINNNSNEMRGEAHAAFDKIADSYEKADMIDYIDLFKMLTINGAKAIGLEREIGTIEEGKRADLVLWSKNDLPFIPGYNYLADLIFTEGGQAHTVYIDGRKIIDNYKLVTVDEDSLKRKARGISSRYHNAFQESVAKHL
jgi:5-methylthioadenosine/S-adenosylhomocysteine deaminase